MDKLRLLKELEKLRIGNTLDTDEIRLYLLLLANCRNTSDGKIGYGTIRDAIGEGFSPERLKEACRELSVHELVEVTAPCPDEMTGENFTLNYRIFPIKGNRK